MKKTLLTLSALALAGLMSGCTSATDMTTATTPPTATNTAAPNVTTIVPGVTSTDPNGLNGADGVGGAVGDVIDGVEDGVERIVDPDATIIPESTGVTSTDKAKRVIEQIEDELERLSEVDDAEVVIAGNKAAVGIEFDSQYQGGIDDRLRSIIKERIDSVISGISTVAITADEGVMDAIESLGERLETMSDMSALQSDLDAIIKKINGMNA